MWLWKLLPMTHWQFSLFVSLFDLNKQSEISAFVKLTLVTNQWYLHLTGFLRSFKLRATEQFFNRILGIQLKNFLLNNEAFFVKNNAFLFNVKTDNWTVFYNLFLDGLIHKKDTKLFMQFDENAGFSAWNFTLSQLNKNQWYHFVLKLLFWTMMLSTMIFLITDFFNQLFDQWYFFWQQIAFFCYLR